MPRRFAFHAIWASIAILGSTIVLMNFFLPYTFSSVSTMPYTLWSMTVALAFSGPLSGVVTGAAALYWLAILLPMGAALRLLLGSGKRGRAWLQFSVVLAILGFFMSVFFDWLIISLAGCCVAYHGGASPSHVFNPGPDFWLAPIGFLLSLGSCSLCLLQKTQVCRPNT
jgi:hypothetical protein